MSAMSGGGDTRCPACGCVGPNPGTSRLTEAEARERAADLAACWTLDAEAKRLRRSFVAKNFKEAMRFLELAGEVAERADIQHHPDLHLTKYREVEVVLMTHAADGLTDYDFKLARALSGVGVECSPKWLRDPQNEARAAAERAALEDTRKRLAGAAPAE